MLAPKGVRQFVIDRFRVCSVVNVCVDALARRSSRAPSSGVLGTENIRRWVPTAYLRAISGSCVLVEACENRDRGGQSKSAYYSLWHSLLGQLWPLGPIVSERAPRSVEHRGAEA
jgi:hypothetical protein